jgi:phospholipid/cholesterol/gamma-HCH transport system permease protein
VSGDVTQKGDIVLDAAAGAAVLRLTGEWVMPNLVVLERKVHRSPTPDGDAVTVDGSGVGSLDTAGVYLLRTLRARLEAHGKQVTMRGLRREFIDLLALVDDRLGPTTTVPVPERKVFLERIGRATYERTWDFLGLLAFVGQTAIAGARQLGNPRRIRGRETAKIIEHNGLNALPIVGLLTFLLGIVVAYQGGVQLRTYGANIFVVELVGLIMLRELAPLIAAIIVAGRTGSAYAAEIGTMRVTEEVDAMKTIGISPYDQLVLPKVIGLMLAMPLLTVFADALGILGGMVMASNVLDVSFTDFLQRMPEAVSVSDFVVGIVKAPVFALIIAMVGCYQGFQVSGGADSVGRQTTIAVVQSIFLVIIADAAFSILFSWLGV